MAISSSEGPASSQAGASTPEDVPPALTPAFAAASDPKAGPPSGIRLLLAEDNKANQEVALYQLSKLGYHADVAVSGREAVEAHARQPYDLILMDCQMPDMDGYQAAINIRLQPGRRIPIIAITANALDGDRQKCLEAGMDDYLAKPVTLGALRTALKKWLAQTPAIETLFIDFAHLREVTEEDEEGMRRLVELYLIETEKDLEKLRLQIQAGNATEVRRLSHGAAGAGMVFGMNAIVNPLRDIEHRALEGRLEEAPARLANVREIFEKIKVQWRAYVSPANGGRTAL